MRLVADGRRLCDGHRAWEEYLQTQPDTFHHALFDELERRFDEAFAAEAAAAEAEEQEDEDHPSWRLGAEFLSREQLANLPAPRPVIEGTLFQNTLVVLAGAPGAGKSFVAIDWALSIATGTPWHDRKVCQGRVAYIAAEGVSGFDSRISAWETARKQDVGREFRVLPRAHNLLDSVTTQALAAFCKDFQPSLIVIDTLSRSIVGADENSAQDMTRAVAHADLLKNACGAAVVLVHHVAKGSKTPRGSGALVGAADTMYAVEAESSGVLKLKRTKSKDTEPDDELTLRLVAHEKSVALELMSSLNMKIVSAGASGRLLALMRDTFGTTGATKSELKATSGMPNSSYYRALNLLVSDGLIVETGPVGRPIYRVSAP